MEKQSEILEKYSNFSESRRIIPESKIIKIPNINGPVLSLESAVFLARFLAMVSYQYKQLDNLKAVRENRSLTPCFVKAKDNKKLNKLFNKGNKKNYFKVKIKMRSKTPVPKVKTNDVTRSRNMTQITPLSLKLEKKTIKSVATSPVKKPLLLQKTQSSKLEEKEKKPLINLKQIEKSEIDNSTLLTPRKREDAIFITKKDKKLIKSKYHNILSQTLKNYMKEDSDFHRRLIEYENPMLCEIFDQYEKFQEFKLFRFYDFKKFMEENKFEPDWHDLKEYRKDYEFFVQWGELFFQNYDDEGWQVKCDGICHSILDNLEIEFKKNSFKFGIFDERDVEERTKIFLMCLDRIRDVLDEVKKGNEKNFEDTAIDFEDNFTPKQIIQVFRRKINILTDFTQNRLLCEYYFKMRKMLKSAFVTSLAQERRVFIMRDDLYAASLKSMSTMIPLFGQLIGAVGITWNTKKKFELTKKLSRLADLAVNYSDLDDKIARAMTLLRRNVITSSHDYYRDFEKGKEKTLMKKWNVTKKLVNMLKKEKMTNPEILATNDTHVIEGILVFVMESRQIDIINFPSVKLFFLIK